MQPRTPCSLLSSKGTLLPHIHLGVHQAYQVLFCRAVSSWVAPTCPGALSCSSPGTGPCTSCWTWWGSYQTTSRAYWGPSEWQHISLAVQRVLQLLCNLQTCRWDEILCPWMGTKSLSQLVPHHKKKVFTNTVLLKFVVELRKFEDRLRWKLWNLHIWEYYLAGVRLCPKVSSIQ